MPTISEQDALPAGARLGEFEIQHVLGIGGFGIVYLAFDHALERQVAIKEFMPASLARRGEASNVVVRSAANADTFNLGLRSFINEARLLARFDHPSLVKVYRFWEAHGTAYMVMPYYKGRTLQQVRREMDAPPDEAWLRRLINPLLGALDCLHRENVFHRDVAPDNILLLDDESGPGMGPPVLLDLGAARRVIGDHTQTLTAIVKPSFAPIEQYAETVQLRQGPWTDLYALAAVVHFCITGRPPMPATVRAVYDDLPTLRLLSQSLASGFDRHFSEPFINAIDHALAVRPLERPDSVSAWRAELSGIVSKPFDGKAAPHPAAEWMPQTVLVRNDAAQAPPGHQALEAQGYMKTIPAAGHLSAAPAWPARPMAGAASDGNPPPPAQVTQMTMPTTVPLAQARDVMPSALPAHVAGASTTTWLKWVFVVLLTATAVALWWSQHRAPKTRSPSADQAIAERGAPSTLPNQRTARDESSSKSGGASGEATSSSTASAVAASGAASKPRRQQRQAASEDKRDDAATADTDGPLSPRKACANKSFIMLAICMKRHCVRPEYAAHPECERMRQQEAAQRNNFP